jgi:hypothetical protein
MRNQGPAIDLEEFERRLRAPEPSRRSDDPLAELARLVGSTNDPFKNVFAGTHGAPQASLPSPGDIAAQEVSAETAPHVLRNVADQMRYAAGEYPAPQAYAPAQPQETYTTQQWQQAPQQPETATAYHGGQQQWQAEPQAADTYHQQHYAPPPPPPGLRDEPIARRGMSRKSVLYMGSALAVVMVGVGATLATSGKMKSGSVPTISASSDPIKVKPEGESAGAKPVRTVSLLDKTGSKPQQSNVVSREEQPVDLSTVQNAPRSGQRVPENEINRIVGLGNPNTAKPVASVPGSGSPSAQPAGYFPEPRKVRTVSVKPDGSVVPTPPTQQVAAKPPSIPSIAASPPTARIPAAPPARPEAAAPAPSAAPKATARANKPPAAEEADAAPVASTRRPEPRPTAVPQRVAAAQPAETPRAAATSTSGGGFAVQLAAPASEAEAKSTVARLRQRFASELGSHSPSIRPATVGEKTVYRVRVSGLSREDANSLCSRLQGKGGACFVARN